MIFFRVTCSIALTDPTSIRACSFILSSSVSNCEVRWSGADVNAWFDGEVILGARVRVCMWRWGGSKESLGRLVEDRTQQRRRWHETPPILRWWCLERQRSTDKILYYYILSRSLHRLPKYKNYEYSRCGLWMRVKGCERAVGFVKHVLFIRLFNRRSFVIAAGVPILFFIIIIIFFTLRFRSQIL